jgi:hypothetical protein
VLCVCGSVRGVVSCVFVCLNVGCACVLCFLSFIWDEGSGRGCVWVCVCCVCVCRCGPWFHASVCACASCACACCVFSLCFATDEKGGVAACVCLVCVCFYFVCCVSQSDSRGGVGLKRSRASQAVACGSTSGTCVGVSYVLVQSRCVCVWCGGLCGEEACRAGRERERGRERKG